MAKSAGHLRASKWENSIYHEGGVRKEYGELSDARKAIVKVAFDRTTNKKGRYYLYTVTDVLK